MLSLFNTYLLMFSGTSFPQSLLHKGFAQGLLYTVTAAEELKHSTRTSDK